MCFEFGRNMASTLELGPPFRRGNFHTHPGNYWATLCTPTKQYRLARIRPRTRRKHHQHYTARWNTFIARYTPGKVPAATIWPAFQMCHSLLLWTYITRYSRWKNPEDTFDAALLSSPRPLCLKLLQSYSLDEALGVADADGGK